MSDDAPPPSDKPLSASETRNNEASKRAHFQNYSDYARSLRTWLVAYGIGGPVLFLTNNILAERVASSGCAKTIIFLFLLGVGLQVLLSLINKWCAWHQYAAVADPKHEDKTSYKFWNFINNQSWLDLGFDIISVAAFITATGLVFNIFLSGA